MRKRIRNLLESELRLIRGGLHPDYKGDFDDMGDAASTSFSDPEKPSVKKKRVTQSDRGVVTEDDVMDFVSRCQEVINRNTDEHYSNMPDNARTHLDYKMGRSYAKIIARIGNREGGSAWAFIDLNNGDILKAASWNAPAKHARGNIFDEYEGMKYIGPFGPAYLR